MRRLEAPIAMRNPIRRFTRWTWRSKGDDFTGLLLGVQDGRATALPSPAPVCQVVVVLHRGSRSSAGGRPTLPGATCARETLADSTLLPGCISSDNFAVRRTRNHQNTAVAGCPASHWPLGSHTTIRRRSASYALSRQRTRPYLSPLHTHLRRSPEQSGRIGGGSSMYDSDAVTMFRLSSSPHHVSLVEFPSPCFACRVPRSGPGQGQADTTAVVTTIHPGGGA